MEDQQDLFQETPLIAAVEQQDWNDVLGDPSGNTPLNQFFQFVPPQPYIKYYRLLRIMLDHQQKSKRCFTLTTLMLRIKPGNYYALMLRKDSLSQIILKPEDIAKEVTFVNCLLALNAKEYQLWTYKKYIIQSHPLPLYELQTSFLDELLELDSKNYHVWDYKLWLTIHFHQQVQQLSETQHLLFEPPIHKALQQQLQGSGLEVTSVNWSNCYSLWSYRYNLSENFYSNLQEKTIFLKEEIERVCIWLSQVQHNNNECGWTYLIGISHFDSLDQGTLQKLYDFGRSALDKDPENRFAGNACLELGDLLSEKFGKEVFQRKVVLEQLKSVDSVRSQYYEYLLSL